METGIMPQTKANPQYGDVSDVDFTQMQNQLATAKTLFEELPQQVKDRFNNEMHTFLHFAENPDNLPELVDMGLAVKNERLAQALQAQADEKTTSLAAGNEDSSEAAEGLSTWYNPNEWHLLGWNEWKKLKIITTERDNNEKTQTYELQKIKETIFTHSIENK